jgi:predicted small lipoprotein YifL
MTWRSGLKDRSARNLTVLLLLGTLAACGKKGPPLPPLQLTPSRIEDLSVTRRGDELQMKMTVPTTNEDPKHKTPADVASVEVYALTGKPEDPFGNPLTTQDLLKYSTKIGAIAIKPPPKPEENQDEEEDDCKDGKDKNGKACKPKPVNKAAERQKALKAAMPPDPRPGQGDVVTMKETLTPAMEVPWVHPKKKKTADDDTATDGMRPHGPGMGGTARRGGASGSGMSQGGLQRGGKRRKGATGAQGNEGDGEELPGMPLWWPPDNEDELTRLYFAIGVNHGGKRSTPSNKVFLPLTEVPQAPAKLDLTYDASALTVNWDPPPDAKLPLQRNAEPGELTAKPIVQGGGVTTYNVYDVKALEKAEKEAKEAANAARLPALLNVKNQTGAAPTAPKTPIEQPLNPTPIAKVSFVDPHLVYGEERCYVVRAVLVYGGARLESPMSAPSCVTPKDTFPPSPPKNLAGVGSEGGVSLIWEADSEPDVDGYLVLRGELKPDGTQPETLKPITAEPVKETTYRDTTAKPGVRYVYAVVAVDKAKPRNVSPESNRIEESAR